MAQNLERNDEGKIKTLCYLSQFSGLQNIMPFGNKFQITFNFVPEVQRSQFLTPLTYLFLAFWLVKIKISQ